MIAKPRDDPERLVRKALPLLRRVGTARFHREFGKGEPVRNIEHEREPATKLGATQREYPLFSGEAVDRKVLGPALDVDDLLERNHGDAEFPFVLGHDVRRGARPWRGLSRAWAKWTCPLSSVRPLFPPIRVRKKQVWVQGSAESASKLRS